MSSKSCFYENHYMTKSAMINGVNYMFIYNTDMRGIMEVKENASEDFKNRVINFIRGHKTSLNIHTGDVINFECRTISSYEFNHIPQETKRILIEPSLLIIKDKLPKNPYITKAAALNVIDEG